LVGRGTLSDKFLPSMNGKSYSSSKMAGDIIFSKYDLQSLLSQSSTICPPYMI